MGRFQAVIIPHSIIPKFCLPEQTMQGVTDAEQQFSYTILYYFLAPLTKN
jgi:hypothetical protein